MSPTQVSSAWLLAVGWLSLAAGCASTHTLAVAEGNTAAPGTDPDGTIVLRSELKHVVAVRPLTAKFSNDVHALPSFSVIVRNGGARGLAFTPADITVSSGVYPVAIYDRATLDAMIAKTRTINTQSSGLMSGMKDASQSAETQSAMRDTSYSGETGDYHLQSSLPPYPANSTDPRMEPLGTAPLPPPPYHLPDEALRSQTIPAGAVGGGRVTLDPKTITAGEPLKLVVTIDGEVHVFWFAVRD
jgi:hypothetical protein